MKYLLWLLAAAILSGCQLITPKINPDATTEGRVLETPQAMSEEQRELLEMTTIPTPSSKGMDVQN